MLISLSTIPANRGSPVLSRPFSPALPSHRSPLLRPAVRAQATNAAIPATASCSAARQRRQRIAGSGTGGYLGSGLHGFGCASTGSSAYGDGFDAVAEDVCEVSVSLA